MKSFTAGMATLEALLTVWTLAAQALSAALSGTVHDGHNSAISGAQVVLTEKSKGLARESLTAAGGCCFHHSAPVFMRFRRQK
jgi:hypothetical protein